MSILSHMLSCAIGPYQTRRSFTTTDSPQTARAIVEKIDLKDAFVFGGAPPGVSVVKKGTGQWEASGPGMWVTAQILVEPYGSGGSKVTEITTTRSLVPGGPLWADVVHGIATSPQQAYERARSRR